MEFAVTEEESAGIIGYPEIGLYALMRHNESIVGGELIEEEGYLPSVVSALPRYYPEAAALVVARFDGSLFHPTEKWSASSFSGDIGNAMIYGAPQSGKSEGFTMSVHVKGENENYG